MHKGIVKDYLVENVLLGVPHQSSSALTSVLFASLLLNILHISVKSLLCNLNLAAVQAARARWRGAEIWGMD